MGQARWPAYAAAVGSGLALTSAVSAQIIYSGVQNVTATGALNNGAVIAPIDLDGVGGADFLLGANLQASSFGVGTVKLIPNGSLNQHANNGSGAVRRLASGAAISNGAGIFGAPGGSHIDIVKRQTNFSNPPVGSFAAGQTGFAGVKFQAVDGDHYGWIRLIFSETSPSGVEGVLPNSITAIDWAYNSVAGGGINAGQISATGVPEASTKALPMLLAMGSVGVLAWRKHLRKKTATLSPDTGAAAAN